MKKFQEEYYISEDSRFYICTVYGKNRIWGWYYWYGGYWRTCATFPSLPGLTKLSKEEFDKLFFVENL